MRLTCSQKDLANALNITNKAVDLNSTLPVLNNVYLKVEGKKLFFTATNLEIAISYWIETDVKNEGEITIPSKLLTSYVGYLKNEKVDIASEGDDALVLQTTDSKTKIKGISAKEFPPIPVVEKEGEISVSSLDLAEAINQVVFAASLNTTRPILAGVYCYTQKDELRMVATDSYRLAEKTIKLKRSGGDFNCIIPAKTLMDLGQILALIRDEIDIQITVSKNQVLFIVDKAQITSRLIEGQFPNYQQIIPKETKTKVRLSTSELSLVLKRINLFAKENNNKIILKVNKDGVGVSTDSTQYGEGEVHLKAASEGVDNEVAINSQYLLDVLGNIGVDQIQMELGEKVNPVIIRPMEKSDYLHIVMPLKL